MHKIFYFFCLSLLITLAISCECTKVECVDTPSLYIDIVDSDTGESQLFSTNATLNISDVNVFSVVGGEMVSFPKLEYTNLSISPDPMLLVRLEGLVGNSIMLSTDTITVDTLDLFMTTFPESDCCDASQSIDSISVDGVVSDFNPRPLVFFR